MADEPENLTLLLLRKMDGKLDRLVEDVADLKRRTTSLETSVSDMVRQIGTIHGDFAGQSMRIDRLETRLERIERRLDLTD